MRARLVIAGCVLASFARALPYPLQRSWDDGRFLIDNPQVRHVSLAGLVDFFTRVQFEAYHPLHLLSYWLDVPWFGLNALAIHAVSLGLWIAALCCVHALLLELKLSPSAALLGTLACGLHPVQVEAVSWATGRKDVLALLLGASCLLWQLRSQRIGDRAAWVARGLFVLAALAKTTTLALPLLACTLDVLARRLSLKRSIWRQLPYMVLTLGLGAVVIATWQSSAMLRMTLGGLEQAPTRVLATFAAQLATALWPARTSPMYATDAIATLHVRDALVALGFVVALALAWRAQARLIVAGLLGFVWLMLPVSNLLPMYFPLQDRYLSLPLLPLALAFAALHDELEQRRVLRAEWLFALVVGVLGLRTLDYAGKWSTETTLWGHAASTHPDAEYAWLKLGETRRDAGDLEGAIRADRALVRLVPERKLAYAALAEVTALRDERVFHLSPTRARTLAQQLYAGLDDPSSLRDLGLSLLAAGYLRSAELPLTISFARQPVGDAALARLAQDELSAGHTSVARFLATQLREPSHDARLQALLAASSYRVLP